MIMMKALKNAIFFIFSGVHNVAGPVKSQILTKKEKIDREKYIPFGESLMPLFRVKRKLNNRIKL